MMPVALDRCDSRPATGARYGIGLISAIISKVTIVEATPIRFSGKLRDDVRISSNIS
jgi:hypothetical protein